MITYGDLFDKKFQPALDALSESSSLTEFKNVLLVVGLIDDIDKARKNLNKTRDILSNKLNAIKNDPNKVEEIQEKRNKIVDEINDMGSIQLGVEPIELEGFDKLGLNAGQVFQLRNIIKIPGYENEEKKPK